MPPSTPLAPDTEIAHMTDHGLPTQGLNMQCVALHAHMPSLHINNIIIGVKMLELNRRSEGGPHGIPGPAGELGGGSVSDGCFRPSARPSVTPR